MILASYLHKLSRLHEDLEAVYPVIGFIGSANSGRISEGVDTVTLEQMSF
jgi:hypothetical protein